MEADLAAFVNEGPEKTTELRGAHVVERVRRSCRVPEERALPGHEIECGPGIMFPGKRNPVIEAPEVVGAVEHPGDRGKTAEPPRPHKPQTLDPADHLGVVDVVRESERGGPRRSHPRRLECSVSEA